VNRASLLAFIHTSPVSPHDLRICMRVDCTDRTRERSRAGANSGVVRVGSFHQLLELSWTPGDGGDVVTARAPVASTRKAPAPSDLADSPPLARSVPAKVIGRNFRAAPIGHNHPIGLFTRSQRLFSRRFVVVSVPRFGGATRIRALTRLRRSYGPDARGGSFPARACAPALGYRPQGWGSAFRPPRPRRPVRPFLVTQGHRPSPTRLRGSYEVS
jgi:hypothetical protein